MLTPNDLFEIRKIVVASKLLDSGAFDDQIAKMEDASKAQQEAQVAALAAENAKFTKQAAQMQDDLDAKEAKIQEQLDDIQQRTAQLDIKQAEVNKTSAEDGAAMDALARATQDAEVKAAKSQALMETRAKELAVQEESLAARSRELDKAQQELEKKLEVLKSLTAK